MIADESDFILAVGVPTYKRPERAISLIQQLLQIDTYDQIIVAANSHEPLLDSYISSVAEGKVTFLQQPKNVGIAPNFASIVGLCKCHYLHIISDEDSVYENGVRNLYSWLGRCSKPALVVVTVNDYRHRPYKNAAGRENSSLLDPLGDTAHIGSCIFEVSNWSQEAFRLLDSYCTRSGAAYPTTAAALLSYSLGHGIHYFGEPIIRMGEVDPRSDLSGHRSYGMLPKIEQFSSMMAFLRVLKIPNRRWILLSIYYYFCHHGLQDSYRKFSESIFSSIMEFKTDNRQSLRSTIELSLLLLGYFYFKNYYSFKALLGRQLRKIGLKKKT